MTLAARSLEQRPPNHFTEVVALRPLLLLSSHLPRLRTRARNECQQRSGRRGANADCLDLDKEETRVAAGLVQPCDRADVLGARIADDPDRRLSLERR